MLTDRVAPVVDQLSSGMQASVVGASFFRSVLLLIYDFLLATVPENSSPHPDTGLNIIDLVSKYGYPIEHHMVTTEDGYRLGLFRLPHSANQTNAAMKPAVLIEPGVLCSAADYVSAGPGRGLAFVLVDSGYDVWLGNPRGTTWSRNHTTLSTDDPRFWDFSFHEMGYYDVPAEIDYITMRTGQADIFYMGHSQGSTSFFAMTSQRPEYNNKVRLMVGLAPVVYGQYIRNALFRTMAAFQKQSEGLTRSFEITEILPHSELISNITKLACYKGSPVQQICISILFSMSGYDYEDLDEERLPVFLSNMPAGGSIKQVLHYTQMIRSDIFQQYDYDISGNLAKYGSKKPPVYSLRNVTTPVALFYAKNDWFSSRNDVQRAARELPNVHLVHEIEDPMFNHFDFLWGRNVFTKLYRTILKLMSKYYHWLIIHSFQGC